MNQVQEAELLFAFFHYFVWKERQSKDAAVKIPPEALLASPNTDVSVAAADQGKSDGGEGNQQAKSPPVPTLPTPNDQSSKYRAMADAMLQNFPQHLTHFKDKVELQTTLPPLVATLYIDYPALQAMRGALPGCYPPQALVGPAVGKESGQKRKRVGSDSPGTNKQLKIHKRDDVPTDVKQMITEMRYNFNTEKASNRKQIKRLEAQLNEAREEKKEIAAKAAKIAEEAAKEAKIAKGDAQRLQKHPLSGNKKAKANLVAGEAAGGKPAAQDKPLSEEKPVNKQYTFEERLEELEHFFRGNGHCRVPVRGSAFGRWVSEIRFIYKEMQKGKPSDILTPERIKKLDEMGFEWDLGRQVYTWEERFADLKRFKEKFGHCNVPRTTYKEDPSLGEWVHLQRRQYKQKTKKIMGERGTLLNSIGFVWHTGSTKVTFEERLEECREFRRKNGHLNVPLPAQPAVDEASLNEETNETRSLNLWARWIRDQYRKHKEGKKSAIDKSRIRKLDEMGFVWEPLPVAGVRNKAGKPLTARFLERIEQLRQVKEQYGNCSDMKTLRMAGHGEKSSLYQWVKAHRKKYREMKAGKVTTLSDESLAMFAELDFKFEPRGHYASYGSKKEAKRGEEKQWDDESVSGLF